MFAAALFCVVLALEGVATFVGVALIGVVAGSLLLLGDDVGVAFLDRCACLAVRSGIVVSK